MEKSTSNTPNKKQSTKKSTASKMPEGVRKTFAALEHVKVCFVSNDGKSWYWREAAAKKYFGEGNYKKVTR